MNHRFRDRYHWPSPHRIHILFIVLIASLSRLRSEAAAESLTGKPFTGRNADGQLEVFEVDREGELRHRRQNPSNGDWSSWTSMGGHFYGGIAVTSDAEEKLNVFTVRASDNSVWRTQQSAANSIEWTDWVNLGGAVRPPLAAVQDANGLLHVFGVGTTSNTVKQIRQVNRGGDWSEWKDLGGNLEPGIVATCDQNGRIEIFGCETNGGVVVHRWQQQAGGDSDWSPWTSLGGEGLEGLVVKQSGFGALELFGVNRGTGMVNRSIRNSTNSSSAWSNWEDFGGPLETGIAVGQSADKRLELLAVRKGDGELLHRWELRPDASDRWSDWAKMGKTAQAYPAVGQNEDGNLEVFAVDRSNNEVLNHRRQISRASDWLDWSSMDHTTFQYSSRAFQTGDGLPHNVVQAITQTRDGYLWIGTHDGLGRFDGATFRTFDSRNTPELGNSSVTALCPDRSGALWIGTEGGGVARWFEGSFTRFDTNNGLAGNTIRAICERKDGSVWFGTTSGMSRYKKRVFATFTRKEGLLSDVVTSIYEGQDGSLWIGTGEGLNRLKGDAMESFAMPNKLPGDSVRGICQDKGGRLWIGSNNGMLWYNWYWSSSFFSYNTKYGLSDAFVSAICEDHEGNLWVGTYSGLNRFREGRFFPELNEEGIPFGRINALFEDREGNLWVGSQEGLVRLTPKRFFAYTRRQGLSHNNIMSVLEDRHGSLWCATWGGGLDELREGRVRTYTETNGLAQKLLLALEEGRDGSLWIGSDFYGGLARLKDGKFKSFHWKDGLPNAPLRVIHEDRAGGLWIGTSQGLSCLKDGKFNNYTNRVYGGGESILAICEDHMGRIWLGTDGGLSLREGGTFTNFTMRDGLSDNTITALYEDKETNLWIGTANGGLNRYHNGHFSNYTMRQGLFSNEIFEILEDDFAWLWMSCSKGVFRVRKRDLNSVESGENKTVPCLDYGRTDGMETAQCNGAAKPAGWKSRDGRLWFPTSKGLVSVDPKTTKINQIPPPVFIQELLADKRPVLGEQRLDGIAGKSGLRVAPGRGELEFHYAVVNFRAPDKCRLKYRLVGVDPDWIEAGTRRVAHYNNIFPGNYRFEVQACNEDGVWNEVGAALEFTLLSHFWEARWFRALTVLALIAGSGVLARFLVTRRLSRKLQTLEQRHALERERSRIARDMHDQLGAGLTQVGLLGELAKRDSGHPERTRTHAEKICELAREQAQTLEEIVWTVEPRNDVLNKLAAYMAVYTEEFFQTAGIRCRVDIPPGLPPHPLTAELRHNLFLAVKEALNNVVKHSGASEVWLRLQLEESGLQISIQDNGHGFSQDDSMHFGNGLNGMKQRIEENGGQFRLTSSSGAGTRLVFQVPLPGVTPAVPH